MGGRMGRRLVAVQSSSNGEMTGKADGMTGLFKLLESSAALATAESFTGRHGHKITRISLFQVQTKSSQSLINKVPFSKPKKKKKPKRNQIQLKHCVIKESPKATHSNTDSIL